jgi:ribonuclease HI
MTKLFTLEFLAPSVIICRAKEQQEALNSADQVRRDNLFKSPVVTESHWKPPVEGSIKANWDAAVDRENGRIGIGVVVRDSGGNVIAACCSVLSAPFDLATAEAFGVWNLAEYCSRIAFRKIEVEGDALEVIQAMRCESVCLRSYGHLIDGTKTLLSSSGQWVAQHVKRTGNKAAHLLAKFACNSNIEKSWFLECPT